MDDQRQKTGVRGNSFFSLVIMIEINGKRAKIKFKFSELNVNYCCTYFNNLFFEVKISILTTGLVPESWILNPITVHDCFSLQRVIPRANFVYFFSSRKFQYSILIRGIQFQPKPERRSISVTLHYSITFHSPFIVSDSISFSSHSYTHSLGERLHLFHFPSVS